MRARERRAVSYSNIGRPSSVKRGCRGVRVGCGRWGSGAAAAGCGRGRRRGSSGDGLRRRTLARRWRPEERGGGVESSESDGGMLDGDGTEASCENYSCAGS